MLDLSEKPAGTGGNGGEVSDTCWRPIDCWSCKGRWIINAGHVKNFNHEQHLYQHKLVNKMGKQKQQILPPYIYQCLRERITFMIIIHICTNVPNGSPRRLTPTQARSAASASAFPPSSLGVISWLSCSQLFHASFAPSRLDSNVSFTNTF